jgi:hypothetical protein
MRKFRKFSVFERNDYLVRLVFCDVRGSIAHGQLVEVAEVSCSGSTDQQENNDVIKCSLQLFLSEIHCNCFSYTKGPQYVY